MSLKVQVVMMVLGDGRVLLCGNVIVLLCTNIPTKESKTFKFFGLSSIVNVIEGSTVGDSTGPPPVTSYDIIITIWHLENVYRRKCFRHVLSSLLL